MVANPLTSICMAALRLPLPRVPPRSKYFSKFGALADVALMKDKYTGQPRGFGFIKFEDPAVVDTVLAQVRFLCEQLHCHKRGRIACHRLLSCEGQFLLACNAPFQASAYHMRSLSHRAGCNHWRITRPRPVIIMRFICQVRQPTWPLVSPHAVLTLSRGSHILLACIFAIHVPAMLIKSYRQAHQPFAAARSIT